MTKRHVSVIATSTILGLTLAQFQNCAPARLTAPTGANVDYTDARTGVNSRGAEAEDLTFALAKVEVKDDVTSARIGGLCARAHEGAALKLSLVDGADALNIAEGQCRRGQFQITLGELDVVTCGVDRQLIVEGDWGGSAEVHFVRRCQPVLSRTVNAPDAPLGTTCALEYSPGGGVHGCQRVCFRLDQVVNITTLETNACADLATTLAGP